MAATFQHDEREAYVVRKREDHDLDEEHDFPFPGSKHLDPVGINEDAVKLSLRTRNDFDKPNKLRNPLAPPPKSRTNYEAYHSQEAKSRTFGLFQNDPQRLAVVKHPGEMQLSNQKALLRVNPTIKAYMDKGMALEDRKLHAVKDARIILNEETKRQQARYEQRVLSQARKAMRETWQAAPKRYPKQHQDAITLQPKL